MDNRTSSRVMAASLVSFGVVALCAATLVQAQTYPSKQVRMIVSGAPGGSNDAIARTISHKLSERWGQPVVVENNSGASGAIAVGMVARSTPDGYILGIIGASTLVGLTTNTEIKRDFNFKTAFTPITQLVSQPYVFVINPGLPINSISDLIAYAKKNPGALNYASLGDNTTTHLGMELFAGLAGIEMTHVPYKATAQIATDLMAGRVQALLGGALSSMPLVKTGKLRALAVTSAARSKVMPDLPTVGESGVAGYSLDPWFGLMGPAGLPQAIVQRVHADAVAGMNSADIREKFGATGTEIVTSAVPADFGAMLNREIDRWEKFAAARKK
jgi:tripartite-type tricarboxylate transporter receptor subunit TctC